MTCSRETGKRYKPGKSFALPAAAAKMCPETLGGPSISPFAELRMEGERNECQDER